MATAAAAEEVREGLGALLEKRKPAWLPKIRKAAPPRKAPPKAGAKKR